MDCADVLKTGICCFTTLFYNTSLTFAWKKVTQANKKRSIKLKKMYPLEIHCSAAVLSLENTNDSSDYRVPGKKKQIKRRRNKKCKNPSFYLCSL